MIFSPIEAIFSLIISETTLPHLGHVEARRASTSAGFDVATNSAKLLANSLNSSFLATKSVSQFSSTIAPQLSRIAEVTTPSAAILPIFLSAEAIPFWRRTSIAFSISPSVSTSAFLASIIPAPVLSRSSFTI